MNDYPPEVNPSESPATIGIPTFGEREWPAYTGDQISMPAFIGLLLIAAGIMALIIKAIQPQNRGDDDDPSVL